MIIVKGYKINSSDFLSVEAAIDDLQKLILLQGKKLYTELLAREIESMCDDISFNVIPRPEGPVYDAARHVLDQRISDATGRGRPLPYNFGIQLAIYSHKDAVYIRMNTNNERLVAALKKSPTAMTDFSLHDDRHDSSDEKKKEAVWNEIMELYSEERKPLIRQIIACENANPEWKKVAEKFRSREERAEQRVRHQLTNTLINMLGMGQQIPPHKLLAYTDEALLLYGTSAVQAEVRRMMPQALQSIINITEELVKQDPRAACPPSNA